MTFSSTSWIAVLAAFSISVCGFLPAQQLDATGVTDSFARLLPSRAKTFIKSSSDPDDRADGAFRGNDDGFTGRSGTEAYREGSVDRRFAVLADIQGRPGYVGCFFKNFWSGFAGTPRAAWEENFTDIDIDGVRAYERILTDFIRDRSDPMGQVPPFSGPFTASRSGASLTHTPLVFADSIKIRCEDDIFTNAARFHKVAGVLASPDDPLEVPDLFAWEQVEGLRGSWPHATPHAPERAVYKLAPWTTTRIEFRDGPGALLELRARVNDRAAWDSLQVRIYFDGQSKPAVDVPLRVLGGMLREPHAFAFDALLSGNDGAEEIWSYFPMPFVKQLEIELVNDAAVGHRVELTTSFGYGAYPEPWGYFTAFWNEGITQTHVPFIGPSLEGCEGVMRSIALESGFDFTGRIPPPVDTQHLEGDLCIRINGDRGDAHTFAASETSIGKWGWYLTPADQPFVSDESYNSAIQISAVDGELFMRRMQGSQFVFDPVSFVDGFSLVLEHGIRNESNADYGLLTTFYVKPGPARQRFLDLDIGDPVSEAAHRVQMQSVRDYTLTAQFFRDEYFGTAAVTDTVRELDLLTSLEFTVDVARVDTSHGLAIGFRLDRRRTGEGGLAQAEVFVNGQYAGLLHAWNSNEFFPWKEGTELEVEIPKALTDGVGELHIEVRPVAGSGALRFARVFMYNYLR